MIRRPRTGIVSSASRPAIVVADARCLQNPDYAPCEVGQHSLALVQGFPRSIGNRLVALTDPLLPPMTPDTAALFDAIAVNPYGAQRVAEGMGTLVAYVVLSPMTHDPLYGARFVQNGSLAKVAVVYDFIPLHQRDCYLEDVLPDLGYALRMFWLSRCDCFVPISQSAADHLIEHLQVASARICVSDAPLAAAHADRHGVAPAYDRTGILVVGGDDPRRDLETVIRAHARNAALQRAGTMLTVATDYGSDARAAFKALAQAEGGAPGLVEVPGHIDEAALIALYRSARVVVCASVDEGFPLPVVESMAAGAVVLASDIPAHRKLVTFRDHLFPVGDADRLATLLSTLSEDADIEAAVQAQDQVWPRFRAEHVAERFWSHVLPPVSVAAGLLAAPATARGAKPSIALLSPLPPDRTGVGDYTYATCEELGKRAELHLFSGTKRPLPVPGTVSVLPLSELPCLSARYDRTVCVLGNSHFHTSILDHLERYGGASIAHDARMLSFYYYQRGIGSAADLAMRELGRPVTVDEVAQWMADEGSLQTTFLSAIAAASTPMMVHSPITQSRLQSQFGLETVHLPFSIHTPFAAVDLAAPRRQAARARLGFKPNEVVLVTFGFVDRTKAPDNCLWALERLRAWGIKASLHFVGEYAEYEADPLDLSTTAARLGLGESVRFFQSYLGKDTYRDYLLAADVAIQPRTYGLGGLSGAVLDCAAAGLPCVTNQSLFDAVLPPPAYTAAVPDVLSPVLIAERVAALVGRRNDSDAEKARLDFCRERSLARYARHLVAALELPT